MTPPLLSEWLSEGPFALAMSSGFFGFFAHTGFLSALEDASLLPPSRVTRLCGSSAGALVAGAWASGVTASRFGNELLALRREDFWDPSPGFGLLRGALFRARLAALLPSDDFASCAVPLSVSTYDVLRRRTHVISSGKLSTAIHASCAVPLMFHPVRMDGRILLDGGISDRPGIAGAPTGGRVLYHHLLSGSSLLGRVGKSSLRIPERDGLLPLVMEGLPRVGPFRLEEGRRAFEWAKRRTHEALKRPVTADGVHV